MTFSDWTFSLRLSDFRKQDGSDPRISAPLEPPLLQTPPTHTALPLHKVGRRSGGFKSELWPPDLIWYNSEWPLLSMIFVTHHFSFCLLLFSPNTFFMLIHLFQSSRMKVLFFFYSLILDLVFCIIFVIRTQTKLRHCDYHVWLTRLMEAYF